MDEESLRTAAGVTMSKLGGLSAEELDKRLTDVEGVSFYDIFLSNTCTLLDKICNEKYPWELHADLHGALMDAKQKLVVVKGSSMIRLKKEYYEMFVDALTSYNIRTVSDEKGGRGVLECGFNKLSLGDASGFVSIFSNLMGSDGDAKAKARKERLQQQLQAFVDNLTDVQQKQLCYSIQQEYGQLATPLLQIRMAAVMRGQPQTTYIQARNNMPKLSSMMIQQVRSMNEERAANPGKEKQKEDEGSAGEEDKPDISDGWV